MKKIEKTSALILLFLFLSSSPSFAAYETVRAKTVGNENLQSSALTDDFYVPTANDPELPKFSEDDCVISKVESGLRRFFTKRNFKKNKDELPVSTLQEDENQKEQIAKTPKKALEDKKETVSDKNKFHVSADKLTYDDEDGNVYAKGHVEINAKTQGVVLKADEAALDKTNQMLKLEGNVKIIKDGVEMLGESLLVDLNEENILMDEPTTEAYSFIIKAQQAYLIQNDIQMINGTVRNYNDIRYPFVSRGFQKLEPLGAEGLYDDMAQENASAQTKKQSYTINAKEIVITSYKDHNSLLLKKADILYNNHKIIPKSDIEIISDKKNDVIETNAIEAGNLRGFGTYVGYGFVSRLPFGQTLKIMPAFTYGDSHAGVGAIARHQSKNSSLEAGWSTSTENLIVRGLYNFGRSVKLRYGRKAYMQEGFLGSRRSGYGAQLESEKSFRVKDLDLKYNQGIYAGFFADYKKYGGRKHYYSTSRFRYMGEIDKKLYERKNKEQDLKFRLSLRAQAAATIYGSGETVGIARIGPLIRTKVKMWESSIGYLLGGVHGDSPFYFDKYRYGKSSITLNERFNFKNRFAIGYKAVITPMKDNFEDKLMTESRLYALIGPDDIKLALSYDFVRDVAHFDIMFLLGMDSTKINFDKLKTKDVAKGNPRKDFYKRTKIPKFEEENI